MLPYLPLKCIRAIRKKDDETGHYSENIEYNTQNTYWWEALQIYEKLLKMDISSDRRGEIVLVASMIYKCMGECEKAKALVQAQDSILYSRESLLPRATVGEEKQNQLSLPEISSDFEQLTAISNEIVELEAKLNEFYSQWDEMI